MTEEALEQELFGGEYKVPQTEGSEYIGFYTMQLYSCPCYLDNYLSNISETEILVTDNANEAYTFLRELKLL